jgi:nucleotide-binding universal stress UspA family protein
VLEQRLKRNSNSEEQRFTRILVAVDGSEDSKRAAETALKLASQNGAELEVLHVVPRLTYGFAPVLMGAAIPPTGYSAIYVEAHKEAEKYVGDVMSEAQGRGIKVNGEILEDFSSIVQAITNYAAEKKVDLIVVGTKGRGGFEKLVVGSVSSGVVAHAHCPVIVVK